MSQTWNQHVVKKENKSLVLQTVQQHAPISRANIAQVTGLNKGTVSSLISELIDEQLIYESGIGASSGGRRPVMLLPNEKAGFTISIGLEVNHMIAVLTDLQGDLIAEKKLPFQTKDVDSVLALLFAAIDHLKEQAPPSPYGIVGIGVGVPGVVTNEGDILLAPNLKWKQIPLKQLLSERYQLPIIIENEANAGAYGEKIYGAGKLANEIIYVSAGIGIGVGLILNGKLYKGLRGFSGELGHMTINKDGEQCRCGNQGCWELYASEQALLDQAKEIGFPEATVNQLVQAASQGHTDVLHLFEEIGDYLGVGITNCIHIFNPEQVIIGNTLQQAMPFMLPSIHKRIEQNAIGFNKHDVDLNVAKLADYSTVLGMTAFTIENFFHSTEQALIHP
ncbi:ROK family transcriptional regulator [Gracilibacillus alcaliphilus]|uniref:ROK family transcriptional regulator n=1 Tax=Gracilibacillus alcaliphilus TaxID=1401441 RepID=UPI00195ACE91|nr:ROK family transcriptional regulator [Gracilibacillus alcaliphilus]MBM7676422.1 putative NBD/HSP70 family sugar kinase [Gracilibacillus alcaliphilus]